MKDFNSFITETPAATKLEEAVTPPRQQYKEGDRVIKNILGPDYRSMPVSGTVARTTPTKAVVKWDQHHIDKHQLQPETHHRQADGIEVGSSMSTKWDQQNADRRALQRAEPFKTGDSVTNDAWEEAKKQRGTVISHDLEHATVKWEDGTETKHYQVRGTGGHVGARNWEGDDKWKDGADRSKETIQQVTDGKGNNISHDARKQQDADEKKRKKEIERIMYSAQKMYDHPETRAAIYKLIGEPTE